MDLSQGKPGNEDQSQGQAQEHVEYEATIGTC